MASVPPFSTPPRVWAAPPTAIRLAPKPVDHTEDRRARRQPTVPSVYMEMPFVETATELALTPAENQRGYVLFHRPITEPVYPNTKPLAQERLEQQQDLANEHVVILDTSTLVPGRYHVDLAIIAADGTRCAQERRPLEAVAGPLAPLATGDDNAGQRTLVERP
jgi:hypothetical protein